MKTSESIQNIFKALAAAQGEIVNPEANRTVEVYAKQEKGGGLLYSYKYATLPKCFDAARAPFAKNGLSHTSTIIMGDGGLVLVARIMHESGEWLESDMPIPPGLASKDRAGELTFWKRYLFNGLAGIAGDEDVMDENGDVGPKDNGRRPAGKDRTNWGNQYDKEESAKKPAQGPKLPPEEKKADPKATANPAADPRLEALKRVLGTSVASGWETAQVAYVVKNRFQKESARDLTLEQLTELDAVLKTEKPPILDAEPKGIPVPKDKKTSGPTFDELP